MRFTLKAARVNAKLTQEEAANIIGVTPDTVGKWERGSNFPNVKQIPKIEKAYGLHYDDIIFCD